VDAADLKLLAEFAAQSRRATEELVDRMTPAIWRRVALRWRDLKSEAEDLQGEAFAVLVRWLHEKHDFANEPSLETLASRLVDQAGRAMRWSRTKEQTIAASLPNEPTPTEDSAEDLLAGTRIQERLLSMIEQLSNDQVRTLQAAGRAAAGGPSLAEALRINQKAARTRLCRARRALLELARAEGFTLNALGPSTGSGRTGELSSLTEQENGDD
jgi:DNA-directed RNA polymerase specialized sigma24 family protein